MESDCLLDDIASESQHNNDDHNDDDNYDVGDDHDNTDHHNHDIFRDNNSCFGQGILSLLLCQPVSNVCYVMSSIVKP